MSDNIKIILLAVYIFGFFFCWIKNSFFWSTIKENPRLKKRLATYIFLEPLLWPIYLLQRNPLYLMVGRFFSSYGRKNHHYMDNRGLKFFLNDVFRGKNRYKKHSVFQVILYVTKDSKVMQEFPEFLQRNSYVRVTVANYHNRYRLGACIYSDKPEVEPVSRFDLDEALPLNHEQFIQRIAQYGDDNKQIVLNKLQKQIHLSQGHPIS